MLCRSSNRPVGRRAGIRGRAMVALAATLLFFSLFVDVGVARAAYPEGWIDPTVGEAGACLITCGAFFTAKGPVLKYGLGAGCIQCVYSLFGEINDWMEEVDPGTTCVSGITGQPCGGGWYGWGDS